MREDVPSDEVDHVMAGQLGIPVAKLYACLLVRFAVERFKLRQHAGPPQARNGARS